MKYKKPIVTITGPNLSLWLIFGILLTALRAFHLIDCSWWIVITPLYIPLVAFYIFAAIVYSKWYEYNPQDKVPLGFKKLNPDAVLPQYAHEGDAGMDVYALDDVTLPLHVPVMVHTGIAAEIPDGYELQVRSRSGLACKGVSVCNSPGTVDPKYRGEICVILRYSHSELEMTSLALKQSYSIKKGDRIAQLVLSPVTYACIKEIQDLSDTDRGTAGFGSTGR